MMPCLAGTSCRTFAAGQGRQAWPAASAALAVQVGVFKMGTRGMQAMQNASSLFLSAQEGSAVPRAAVLGVCMMGNRAVMLEVQVRLCAACRGVLWDKGSLPARQRQEALQEAQAFKGVHVISATAHTTLAWPARYTKLTPATDPPALPPPAPFPQHPICALRHCAAGHTGTSSLCAKRRACHVSASSSWCT